MKLKGRIRPVGTRLRERESPKTGRDKRGARALTESDQEFATPQIDRYKRLPCPVQSDVPRKITDETEANIRDLAGQGSGVMNVVG